MQQDVQDAIVAFVEQVAPTIERLHVAWYGGEPLLRLGVIEQLSDRLIEICKLKRLNYDAMIVTNGHRLTGEVARSLHSRRVMTAQVTLDGEAHYHDERRHLLGGGGTFKRIIDNLKQVVNDSQLRVSVRVNIDHRNQVGVRTLLDDLVTEGLAGRPNFRLYFAPVEAMTVGCHSVEEACFSKQDYGQLEAELYRYAFDVGLTALPYPPRFHGTCAAVRPSGWVITPTGDLHKCWDTVTFSQHAIGSIFDLEAAVKSDKAQRWLQWSPFNNATCQNCKLLPNCAGACAYKFLHSKETRGEAATLPCPSWKYNIKERLLLRAERMGAVSREDYNLEEVHTDPRELCADDILEGGLRLPDEMQAYYQAYSV